MRLKTTAVAVAAAVAALSVPAAAFATDDERPANPGQDGRDRAAQHRGDAGAERGQARAEEAKGKKGKKGRGFVVRGTELAGLTVTDDKVAGPFTLDLVMANKHARKLLEVEKSEIRGDDTTTIPAVADDTVRLRLKGVTDGDDEGTDVSLADVLPTDRVKVIGKVARDGELNIRKIMVKRDSETEDEAETESDDS